MREEGGTAFHQHEDPRRLVPNACGARWKQIFSSTGSFNVMPPGVKQRSLQRGRCDRRRAPGTFLIATSYLAICLESLKAGQADEIGLFFFYSCRTWWLMSRKNIATGLCAYWN